jgi:hypothetical protein
MLKSDLVEILAVLTPEEQKRLVLYFNSPYSNQYFPAIHALRLVESMLYVISIKRPAGLQKERLYEMVFPEEPYIFNKLEKQASLALKITRQFIQQESMRKLFNPGFSDYLLGAFYQEKSLLNEFERIQEKLSDWQSQRDAWSSWDFCVNWLIEEKRRKHKSEVYQKKDDHHLFQSLQAIESLYQNERFYNISLLLNLNHVTPLITSQQKNDLIESLKHPRNTQFNHSIPGQLYEQSILLLSAPDPDIGLVESFSKKLFHSGTALNPVQFNHFEVIAINYCVRNMAFDASFLPVLFNLLRQRFESGRSLQNGKIIASEFQNIVKVGLLSGEYGWVWDFMETNRHLITGSQHPEEYYRFNVATFWFYKHEYEKALDILMTLDYHELQYKISSKILEIKILYELESDILPARIDAAKIFFYREKHISPEKKDQYCRFADFMRRLIRPQTSVNLLRIEKLLEELEADPAIAEWYWLREKLNRMLSRKYG